MSVEDRIRASHGWDREGESPAALPPAQGVGDGNGVGHPVAVTGGGPIADARPAVERWPLFTPTVTALAYFLGSLLGLSLPFPGTEISVYWPPNAILLAALLATPRRRWPVYLLAVLPAHVL